MNDSALTLRELICRFEVPPRDAEFPALIAVLGQMAFRRSAASTPADDTHVGYFYLLARAYELLGYAARHMPWLSNSPRFHWHKAAVFLEDAVFLTPVGSSYRFFLQGKLFLREAMIFTVDAKIAEDSETTPRLAQAEMLFADAAGIDPDETLKAIYLDLATIARTEERQRRFRQELHARLLRATKKPTQQSLAMIIEYLETFPSQQFWEFPSNAAGLDWPIQRALARTRPLYAQAHLLDDVVAFLRETRKKQLDETFGAELLRESEEKILRCLDEAAQSCDEAGLIIRAADSRIARLHRMAEASLRRCVRAFRVVQRREEEERQGLLDDAGPRPLLLPREVQATLRTIERDHDPVRVPESIVKAARSSNLPIDDQATIFAESERTWIIRNGADRYLVRDADELTVSDLHKQPIPFNHSEAATFNRYALEVNTTCELYTQAIREIHRVLEAASGWYADISTRLEADAATVAARADANLASMHVTTSSILQELTSRNYPLLGSLRDRRRYAWSLLEMFQMRNRSVRLGTLFSGQCQLIMANPFFDPSGDAPEDKVLEVGADPIFQTTVDFLFRGAKGEANRYDFQRRALRTTGITIDQQEQSLIVESRYLDFDLATRRALVARLSCHRSLVRALDQFTPIFIAQRPGEIKTGTIRRLLDEIRSHFTDAVAALESSGDYPSKLVDRAGLDALHEYMKGIGHVLIGMNERELKKPWDSIYRTALSMLRRARKALEETGDVYLLPRGPVRDEYLHYVDARIFTVEGFKAKYHADEGTNRDEFAKAAQFFTDSASVFEQLHDHRVATKARARAAHAQSQAAKTVGARHKHLKEANALYAACGDALGFRETSELLKEFSDEEAGIPTRRVTSADLRSADVAPQPSQGGAKRIGPYQATRIAVGGMSEVYRAEISGVAVALKRLSERYADENEFIQRFLREFEIGKNLDHPHIVRVNERAEDAGVPYFTMELLSGQPLNKIIARGEKLTPAAAARIAKQVGEALAHAHSRGVIHRDLSPANIMVSQDGFVKVMDFGIARDQRFPSFTKAGEFFGTAEYASPEQLELKPATAASDLYALGLTLYELLTGMRALDFPRRRNEEHPPPSRDVPGIPAKLEEIVMNLLARDPALRYASAAALVADLEVFLASQE